MTNRLTNMIAVWRGVLGGMTARPWSAVSRNTAFDDWRIEGPDGSTVRPSKGDSEGIATLRNIATRLLDVAAAAHAARRFGTITHSLDEALDQLADDPDGTAKWWVGGEHFVSDVVSPVVEPWEVRRAREWLRDHGRLDHRERVDTLSALLRDCWAAGYSDGWDAGAISAHHDADRLRQLVVEHHASTYTAEAVVGGECRCCADHPELRAVLMDATNDAPEGAGRNR